MIELNTFPLKSTYHTHVVCTDNISALKCVVVNRTYVVEIQDKVLAPLGPSSISAVAELVYLIIATYKRLNYSIREYLIHSEAHILN